MNRSHVMITETERQLIIDRYIFYCQFNFPEIALNRLTWDFGYDVEIIKSILNKQQNSASNGQKESKN